MNVLLSPINTAIFEIGKYVNIELENPCINQLQSMTSIELSKGRLSEIQKRKNQRNLIGKNTGESDYVYWRNEK